MIRTAAYQLAIEVQPAFYKEFPCHKTASAVAGRVVSGLLKAAAKSGEVQRQESSGRVNNADVRYIMTEETAAKIKQKAIERAKTYDFFKG